MVRNDTLGSKNANVFHSQCSRTKHGKNYNCSKLDCYVLAY